MKIGIIGLGLIGGSILKKLSNCGHEIYAVTRNSETISKIKNLVTSASSEYKILSECQIVFVCTPISTVLDILDKLENILPENCIVTDVSSVKKFVTNKKRPYKFIPSHPMAGTENSGYDFSFENLFIGAKWVITPYEYFDTEILKTLILQCGAIPIIATPEEHDEAVALISHLPMFIAQCLCKNISNNLLAKQLAASGFRDTTRLALTDLVLAQDMIKFNSENIKKSFNQLCENASFLFDNYKEENLSAIKQCRREMYSQDGKNIVKNED